MPAWHEGWPAANGLYWMYRDHIDTAWRMRHEALTLCQVAGDAASCFGTEVGIEAEDDEGSEFCRWFYGPLPLEVPQLPEGRISHGDEHDVLGGYYVVQNIEDVG